MQGLNLWIFSIAAFILDSLASAQSLEVVFSPSAIKQSHLEKAREWIVQTESSLDIAMYSMSESSSDLIKAIAIARTRNIPVRLLFDKANADRLKPQGSLSAKLEEMGVDVRYINKIMHHKFALLDARSQDQKGNPSLITGSANWTNSAATTYDENTIFVRNEPALIQVYRQEFDRLWANSRDFIWQDLPSDLSVDAIPSKEDSKSLAVFTSDNFQVTKSRYGLGFSTIEGKNTVSDVIVAAILSAKTSIKIASGHFRSHAIAQALLEAKNSNPQLDVKIYLDAQEFISYSYQKEQKAKQDSCLATSVSTEDTNQCYEKGYYYSYEAQAAGLDLRFKSYAYRWHYTYAPQMHHKYMIIDDRQLLSGSYNYSDNAEHGTMENLMILNAASHPDVLASFIANYASIWELDRSSYQPLLGVIAQTDNVPIVFRAMALSWQEFSELKKAIYDNCKLINSEDYRTHPEHHLTCPRNSP